MAIYTVDELENFLKERELKLIESKAIVDEMIEKGEIKLEDIYFRDIKEGDLFLSDYEIVTVRNAPCRMDDNAPYKEGEVLKVYADGGSVGRIHEWENAIVQKVIKCS